MILFYFIHIRSVMNPTFLNSLLRVFYDLECLGYHLGHVLIYQLLSVIYTYIPHVLEINFHAR